MNGALQKRGEPEPVVRITDSGLSHCLSCFVAPWLWVGHCPDDEIPMANQNAPTFYYETRPAVALLGGVPILLQWESCNPLS
jgi:hypothetical protein